MDGIYKKIGAIDIDVVGHVALAVLEGLTYLYDVHRIIHRGEFTFHPINHWGDFTWLTTGRLQISNRPTFYVIHRDKSRSVILVYQAN